ncbi:MAG TPA: HemK/PrmC family methyltransferase, partial [Anaerolineae bacterium]
MSNRQLKKAAFVTRTNGTHSAMAQPTADEPCRDTAPFPFVWSLDRSSNVGRALLAATRRLRESGSETSQLDAAVLMAHVLGVSKTWLYAHPDRNLTEEEIGQFEELVRRRIRHEPVAYLVGYKSFFGLDITVDRRVLIPRPETELLVERVLTFAQRLAEEGESVRIADVGTGSGALAVALAVNLPEAAVYAVDISDDALAVAAQNVWRYGLGDQVQLLPGYLLAPLPEPVHVIVANLP